MKHLSKLMSGLALLALASCASDEPAIGGDDNNAPKEGLYSTISFRMPSTRSTDMEAVEVGQDSENSVGSVLVLVTQKGTGDNEYKYVTYALNDAPITGTTTPSKHTIVFQDKNKLYGLAGQEVYFFAFCNPSPALVTEIVGTFDAVNNSYSGGLAEGTDISTLICDENVESTWTPNGFLMTSVDLTPKTLPSKAELQAYNTPNNAYPLGTIEVVRTCSRFDFRDASPAETAPLTYEIKDEAKPGKPKVADIKLTRMALFNMRNEFYYLPRTMAADGTGLKVCPSYDGMDADGIYVVTPAARNFSYPIPTWIDPSQSPAAGTASGTLAGLEFKSIAEVLGASEDDDNWDTTGSLDKGNFHIWDYVTENAWGKDADPNFAGTTGYVFEAEVIVADDFGNKNADGTYETMYVFNNTLYASAKAVKEAVALTPVSNLATAYKAGFTENADGTITPKSDAELRNLGFYAYHPSTEGRYFCYYFAPNTHNDDGDITKIGVMEHATVRNNVYKLSIKRIQKFGSFEPEPLDSWDTYFTLDVQVRDWIVRINEMEF